MQRTATRQGGGQMRLFKWFGQFIDKKFVYFDESFQDVDNLLFKELKSLDAVK